MVARTHRLPAMPATDDVALTGLRGGIELVSNYPAGNQYYIASTKIAWSEAGLRFRRILAGCTDRRRLVGSPHKRR